MFNFTSATIAGSVSGVFNTTSLDTISNYSDDSSDSSVSDSDFNWFQDILYPIFGCVIVWNSHRRIRQGVLNNIAEVKHAVWPNYALMCLILVFIFEMASWGHDSVVTFLYLICLYLVYLWIQMRLHQATTQLEKFDYVRQYLQGTDWIKNQFYGMWAGQLREKVSWIRS